MKSAPIRLTELDVLRGIAALAVALFHYTFRYQQIYGFATPPQLVFQHGSLGVEFFFGISGFVIFMTLESTRKPMDFVISRVARLWPAYIAALIITFTVVHVAGLPGRETTLPQALADLTLFQEFLHVPDVDPVYWSLEVEIIFYCWMLAVYYVGMLHRIRVLQWAALALHLICYLVEQNAHRSMPNLLSTLLIVRYLPFFVIGISAYNVRETHAKSRQDALLLIASVGVAAICLPAPDAFAALLTASALYAVARGALRWIAHEPLIFLGSISYTFYLLHQNIGYVIIRTALHHGVSTELAIVGALLISVGLAALLSATVERPARKAIRALYSGPREQQKRATLVQTQI